MLLEFCRPHSLVLRLPVLGYYRTAVLSFFRLHTLSYTWSIVTMRPIGHCELALLQGGREDFILVRVCFKYCNNLLYSISIVCCICSVLMWRLKRPCPWLGRRHRPLRLKYSSSRKLVVLCLLAAAIVFFGGGDGGGHCFCCYLKWYQAIHVKPYESCYWTPQRGEEKEKAMAVARDRETRWRAGNRTDIFQPYSPQGFVGV